MESLQGLLSETGSAYSLFMKLCARQMNECGQVYVLNGKTETSTSSYTAKAVNSCHHSDSGETVCWRFTVNVLPIVMPKCVVIPTRIKRHKISQRTEPRTSHSVCGLVGTCGPVVPLPLLPPTSLPLHLSLVSPLDANTNQHFMSPGALKQPP